MIYQPRSIQPTYKSIDANSIEEISLVMNTSDKVTAYRLTVYDWENNMIYQGDKTDFAVALYNGDTGFIELGSDIGLENGKDYKWTARLYQDDANMQITYGNVVEPTLYNYNIPSGGLSEDDYVIEVGDYGFAFNLPLDASQGDVLCYDSYDDTIILRYNSGTSESSLAATKITLGNFADLTMTQDGSVYKYTVTSDGLNAADYHIQVLGRDVWFTTLSDLKENDYITYNPTTKKVTQTYNDITISLQTINAVELQVAQAINTTTNVYLKQNINIKPGMLLNIGDETKEISDYSVNTGLCVVSEAFSSIPTHEDKYIVYSDFIETTPENVLYVRETPVVTITNYQQEIHTKEYTFTGSYIQSDDVPLVYFIWNLYSITDNGAQLIKTSGKVYSANIQFYYNGFKPGETYRIELGCETEFGVLTTTMALNFVCNYTALSYDDQPVTVSTEDQGLRVSWATLTSDAPYSLSTDRAKGYIQSNNNSSNVIWLERGQDIYPGQIVIVGSDELEGTIGTYNKNNGKTTLSIPLSHAPVNGDYYYIVAEPDYNLTGINILNDVPYNGVNSAQLGSNLLVYEKRGGLATWADEYQLTMQFKPDENFFFGNNGIYNDMIQIARYKSESDDIHDLIIYARNYNFGAMSPTVDDGDLVGGQVTAQVTVDNQVQVSGDIDLSEGIRYICFVNSGYVDKIESFDSETNTITLSKNMDISVQPNSGDYYFLYSAIETSFYDNPNNTFVLQATNIQNIYADYIWTDDSSWNDNYYWVEGGTQIGRASENWWKIKVTNNDIKVLEGGV